MCQSFSLLLSFQSLIIERCLAGWGDDCYLGPERRLQFKMYRKQHEGNEFKLKNYLITATRALLRPVSEVGKSFHQLLYYRTKEKKMSRSKEK